MDRVTDEIHALTGKLGQVPMGDIAPVAIIPDDWVPPDRYWGACAARVVANAAFPSIVGLVMGSAAQDARQAILIERVGLRCTVTTTPLEIVIPDPAEAGFTDLPFYSADRRRGLLKPPLFMQIRNTVAALAPLGWIMQPFLVSNVDYQWINLRALLDVNGRAIHIRSTLNNNTVDVIAEYRLLYKRSL